MGRHLLCALGIKLVENTDKNLVKNPQGKSYLHFNSMLSSDAYDILLHDENPLAGHFEPLLCKNKIDGSSNIEQYKVQKFNTPKNIDTGTYLQKVCLENNSELRESLYIVKSTDRKKILKDSGIEENKV